MKLLGSMTCAGSMVLFLYLIFMAALKKSFGAKHRYRILIMALFFYMVPVQLGHYMDIAQDIVQDRAQERTLFMDQEGNRVYDMSQNVIEVTWEGKIYFPFMAAKITLFIVWSIVAVTIIFLKLSGYGKERRILFEASEDITVKETLEALIGMFPEADLIFLEGMKDSCYPKIEVIRKGISGSPVSNPEGRFLIVTDTDRTGYGEETAGFEEIDRIIEKILEETAD